MQRERWSFIVRNSSMCSFVPSYVYVVDVCVLCVMCMINVQFKWKGYVQ